jgi:hypothetical protein
VRHIILDAGNNMIDIHSMDDDFSKNDLYDPYKTYLLEVNEKLRKQALYKIVSNALNSTNSIKQNSISKRLKSGTSGSYRFSSTNESQFKSNENHNEKNSLNGVMFSKNKDAFEMYSSQFFKKKLCRINLKELTS